MFFALAVTSLSITGGWKEVKRDSNFVQNVEPYLKRNYLNLLPEYQKRNTLLVVESAQIQIVNGYNIRINAKLGFDAVEFTLHVAPSKSIQLNTFHVTPSNDAEKTQLGGWKIQDADYEPKFVNQIVNEYKSNKNLNAELTKVLFVRTQIVSGINIHVVYQDANGVTHSVVAYRPPTGKIQIQESYSF